MAYNKKSDVFCADTDESVHDSDSSSSDIETSSSVFPESTETETSDSALIGKLKVKIPP